MIDDLCAIIENKKINSSIIENTIHNLFPDSKLKVEKNENNLYFYDFCDGDRIRVIFVETYPFVMKYDSVLLKKTINYKQELIFEFNKDDDDLEWCHNLVFEICRYIYMNYNCNLFLYFDSGFDICQLDQGGILWSDSCDFIDRNSNLLGGLDN